MMRALVRDASCDGTNGELRRITVGLEELMNSPGLFMSAETYVDDRFESHYF